MGVEVEFERIVQMSHRVLKTYICSDKVKWKKIVQGYERCYNTIVITFREIEW